MYYFFALIILIFIKNINFIDILNILIINCILYYLFIFKF